MGGSSPKRTIVWSNSRNVSVFATGKLSRKEIRKSGRLCKKLAKLCPRHRGKGKGWTGTSALRASEHLGCINGHFADAVPNVECVCAVCDIVHTT